MDNLYQAPQAQLLDSTTEQSDGAFFVTSLNKLVILFIATLGLYVLYWGYKQWSSQRASMPKKIMPVWRSIFSIFFMHSLCKRISQRLESQGQPAWAYGAAATLYVLTTIVSSVISNLTSRDDSLPLLVDILSLLLQLTPVLPLVAIQRQANLASQDPQGSSNSQMSSSNIVFIVIGAVFWVFILLGLLAIAIIG